jgi:hypothetical protein
LLSGVYGDFGGRWTHVTRKPSSLTSICQSQAFKRAEMPNSTPSALGSGHEETELLSL